MLDILDPTISTARETIPYVPRPTRLEGLRVALIDNTRKNAEAVLLELADKLNLSTVQRERIKQLFDSMKAEAVPIGAKLIEQETMLDRQFASRSITSDRLQAATAEIGATQAALRNAHLKYHLETVQILSGDQMRQYAMLRGYADNAPTQHRHAH